MIEHIEQLSAELNLETFGDVGVFEDTSIRYVDCRSTTVVARHGAKWRSEKPRSARAIQNEPHGGWANGNGVPSLVQLVVRPEAVEVVRRNSEHDIRIDLADGHGIEGSTRIAEEWTQRLARSVRQIAEACTQERTVFELRRRKRTAARYDLSAVQLPAAQHMTHPTMLVLVPRNVIDEVRGKSVRPVDAGNAALRTIDVEWILGIN